MKKFFTKQKLEILIILFLGLTPLLWFHGNQVILGHDAGLPLDPVMHFLDRLNGWTDRFGFGVDEAMFLPGFFIHGIEAFVSSLGFPLQAEQKITFIFWFVLPGLTMYYLGSRLEKKYKLPFIALPAAIFYMFNHFLLQGWFIAERTKFSLYAAIPLLVLFFLDWEEKKLSSLKAALLISLTFFFLNGGGSLPLFGGVILVSLSLVFFYFVKETSMQRLTKFLFFGILTIVTSILLNAYWLFPFFRFILHSYSATVSQAGGLSGVLGWVNYVSQDDSLINLLRLQGIPEWYQNPFHPYANVFLSNPFLIAVSYLLPIAAFSPLLLIKEKGPRKIILLLAFIALLSIIFAAGSHPPFGTFYLLLINFLPGFIAFRTPFYKFAPALWFSYALLIGFAVNYVLNKRSVTFFIKNILLGVICAGIILYSYPFLTGQFFNYIVGQRSNKVSVPQYVFDFAKWSQTTSRENVRTLALPRPYIENNVDVYNWGYWSPAPITTLLTKAPIVNPSGFMAPQEITQVENLYTMMKNNTNGWEEYAKSLGIQSFLLRKDFAWDKKDTPTDSPQSYAAALHSGNIKLVKKFGQWEVYDFVSPVDLGRIQVSDALAYVVGDANDMALISQEQSFNGEEPFYIEGDTSAKNENILQYANKIYIKPVCIHCNLQNPVVPLDAYTPVLTRSSVFYSLLKKIKKPAKTGYVSTDEYQSLTNILEFQKEIDQKEDTPILLSSMREYIRSLSSLYSSLQSFLNNKNQIDNAILVDIDNILRSEKIILVQKINLIKDKDLLDLYKQSYQLLGKVKGLVNSNVWMSTDEIHKKYLVSIPKNGEYQILYKQEEKDTPPAVVSLSIDNQTLTQTTDQVTNNWLSLGQVKLDQGKHRVMIEQPLINLYKGPQSFMVSASNEGSCFFSDKIDGKSNQVVRISFLHKRVSGSKSFTVFTSSDTSQINSLNIQGDVLSSNYYLQNYTADYAFNHDNESFYLAICSSPSTDETDIESAIEIENLNIRKLYSPDILLVNSVPLPGAVDKVNYNALSATDYEINSKQNVLNRILIFKESFNPNWKLNGNRTMFMVNGFANAWIIDGKNKATSILYGSQTFVLIGFTISGVAVMLTIIYFLTNRKN